MGTSSTATDADANIHLAAKSVLQYAEASSQVSSQNESGAPEAAVATKSAPATATEAALSKAMCFEHASGAKPERKGQITSSTSFGVALQRLASKPDVRRIIEIGTWYAGTC